MATYHQERKMWVQMIECCEEALTLIPDAKKESNGEFKMSMRAVSLLIFLAHAAEGQGSMRRAREYDDKAKRLSSEIGNSLCGRFVGCARRETVVLLAAGRPHEAAQMLALHLLEYANLLDPSGINLMQLYLFKPVMAALKVLVDALVQIGDADAMSGAVRIRADVEETEAILAGIWEGVWKRHGGSSGSSRKAP